MTYKKINDSSFSSYVIVSDISCEPIEVTDTAISGIRVANIKIDGEDNKIYVTHEDLSTGIELSSYMRKDELSNYIEDISSGIELSSYMRKDELSNYLSVVDEEPSAEQQAANPLVIWFVKKQQ